VSDFDPEEIRRKSSVSATIVPCEWKDVKINVIDTPGQFDFSASVSEGFRAAGSSVIVISGKSGVSVGAQKAFDAATKKGIAKIFFINKIDHEHADFYKVFEDLKATFGPMVCPIVVPYVVEHKVECYINLIDYRAYAYKDGKATVVPMPDMGHRL
jgi:elongation factor G